MNKLLYPATVDGINYLIDKDEVLKQGDLAHSLLGNIVIKVNRALEEVYMEDENVMNGYSKIIAVEYPNKVEGLLQYKLPDEIIELAIKEHKYNHKIIDETSFVLGFRVGYKANKTLYTEEDIIQALKVGHTTGFEHSRMANNPMNLFVDNYINLLNKPKETKSVEAEYSPQSMERNYSTNEFEDSDFEPNLDNEGFLIINKVNYK